MTKKRLAALLMAVLLCISCMNVGYAECEEHNPRWIIDERFHGLYCDMCEESVMFGEHSFDENGYCSVCDYECEHEWSDYIVDVEDESIHLKHCSKCNCVRYEKHSDLKCVPVEYDKNCHDFICGLCNCEFGREFHNFDMNGYCADCDYQCEHDFDTDGYCTICNAECEHVYGTDGYCTICHMECDHDWEYSWNSTSEHKKECRVCHKTVIEKHGDWYYEADEEYGHDVICGICDENIDFAVHNFNSSGKCTVCDYQCSHKWDIETSDEHTHSKKCDICGTKVTEEHSDLSYVPDEASTLLHYIVCGVCEYDRTYEYHTYNHEIAPGKCTLCNYQCEHVNAMLGGFTDDIHEVKCPDCKYASSEKHTYVNGECSVCHHKCGHSKYQSGVCAYCGTACAHEWRDIYGNCEDCGFTCKHSFDESHTCTKCGWACEHQAECAVGGISETQHQTECMLCGAIVGKGNHDFSDGVCDECYYECKHKAGFDDNKLCLNCRSTCQHKTTYATVRDDDDYGHELWCECETCQEYLGSVSHNYENGVCTVCNHTCGHSERTLQGNCAYCGFTCEHVFDADSHCPKCDWTCEHKDTEIVYENSWIHKESCVVCGKRIRGLLHSFNNNGYCEDCDSHCKHDEGYNDEQECNICGMKCQHEHMVYTAYETYHDGECECGYTVTEEKHNYVNGACTLCGATCTKHEFNDKGECQICGFKCAHDHGTFYIKTGTGHEKLCSYCGFSFGGGKHTFNENHVCTVCEYTCKHPDEAITVIGSKEATATEPGATGDKVCSICEAIITPNAPIAPTDFTDLKGDVKNILTDYYDATYLTEKFIIVDNAISEANNLKYDFEKSYEENMAALQKIVDDAKAEIDKACEPFAEGIAEIDEMMETLGNDNIFGIIGKMMGGEDADAAREAIADEIKQEYCNCVEGGMSPEAAMQEAMAMISALDNICKAADAVDEAAGDSTDAEILKVVDDFYAQVEKTMKTSGIGTDFSELSAETVEKINALKKAVVNDVKFGAVVNAGTPAWFTVKTNTNTASLNLLAEDKSVIKSWNSGYTDADDVRTWEISNTFTSAGQCTLYFQPVNADGAKGEEYRYLLNVFDNASVNTVWYDGQIMVGEAEHFTVTTSINATALALYDENKSKVKSWTKYTDKNGQRTWEIDHTFTAAGSQYVYFAAANANGTFGSMFGMDLEISSLPTVKSAAFAAGATAGKAVTITVKTTTDAASLTMCAENKAAVKTWTSGYTDASGVRTWKISYTFNAGGNRTLYFKAANKSGAYGDLVEAKVTVGTLPTVKSAAFAAGATAGKPVTITVKTTTDAASLTMRAENKGLVKTWTDGYTDANGVRTWKISYTFGAAGSRTLYFHAGNKSGVYGDYYEAKVTVGTLPTVKSAVFAAGAMAGNPVSITVKTTTDATSLTMRAENKGLVKTWTDGYTDANGVRTWKISYTFGASGDRTLYFHAGNKSGVYGDYYEAKVTVAKKVETKAATFTKTTAKLGEAVTITVKTGTAAKVLALCAENGYICGSWNADGNSKIVGSERVWTVTYKFTGAGNRTIGFKASEDGKTWGAAITSKITITKK